MNKNCFKYFCSCCIYFLLNIPSENIQQAGHFQCARVADTAVVLIKLILILAMQSADTREPG